MSTGENSEITQLKKELERLKSAVEELTVLNDLAIAASSSLEVDQMLDIIVQKSIKAVKAEQGKIMLVTEEKGSPLQTLIRQDNFSGRSTSYNVGTHITGWVLKNQKTLLIDNLATDNRFLTSEEEKKEIRSVLCVPMWLRAKIVGVLMVTNKKSGETFTENDSRLLSIIAAQSGQLIRNSQLQEEAIEKKRMEQELTFARNIQMSLVPAKDPKSDRYEIASYFNPADEVGGDYFDYFFLDKNQIAIVQADVSGHGVSAAMIMTMVKGILSSVTHKFTTADEALLEVNSTLSKIAPQEMFVTMIFMVLDLEKKILKLSNAGHNPPLLYSCKSKSFDWIEIQGCALNLTESPAYQIRGISINSNDIILLYTDGVTETINIQSELYGKDRLAQALKKGVDDSPAEIINHIRNDLNTFSNNSSQTDDIALIAIKIK